MKEIHILSLFEIPKCVAFEKESHNKVRKRNDLLYLCKIESIGPVWLKSRDH